MESNGKSKLMKMYKKTKSNRSMKSCPKSDKKNKKKGKHKSRSSSPECDDVISLTTSNKELDDYLSFAIQENSLFLKLPICILEHIFYDYFYSFQIYKFIPCCKLFRYLIDDTLQSQLNSSINDHRIHNFRLNAFYFYNNLSQFIVTIKSSIILDLSNETLRIFNNEQKQFISYLFMFQSKLSTLYKKEISSSKFKRFKKKELQQLKKKRFELKQQQQQFENNETQEIIKGHHEILEEFVSFLSECTKVICGGNAIWFHVIGMDIFEPILHSKYCLISSLSLDRNYINDEILLLFCRGLLLRSRIYAELSPFYDCRFLKRLDFSHNNNITDIGLNTLFAVIGEKCPMLQEIYLSNLASITNLTCKIIYKFYQLFGQHTRLKIIVLNRNKFIDENGVNILNDLFKNNIIDIGENIRFFVAQCRIGIYNNCWDDRIKLEMPDRIH